MSVALAVVLVGKIEIKTRTTVAEEHASTQAKTNIIVTTAEEARHGKAKTDADTAADLERLASYCDNLVIISRTLEGRRSGPRSN